MVQRSAPLTKDGSISELEIWKDTLYELADALVLGRPPESFETPADLGNARQTFVAIHRPAFRLHWVQARLAYQPWGPIATLMRHYRPFPRADNIAVPPGDRTSRTDG
jgi:hypothetical protein